MSFIENHELIFFICYVGIYASNRVCFIWMLHTAIWISSVAISSVLLLQHFSTIFVSSAEYIMQNFLVFLNLLYPSYDKLGRREYDMLWNAHRVFRKTSKVICYNAICSQFESQQETLLEWVTSSESFVGTVQDVSSNMAFSSILILCKKMQTCYNDAMLSSPIHQNYMYKPEILHRKYSKSCPGLPKRALGPFESEQFHNVSTFHSKLNMALGRQFPSETEMAIQLLFLSTIKNRDSYDLKISLTTGTKDMNIK